MTLIFVYLISVLVSWKLYGYFTKKMDRYSENAQTAIYGTVVLGMLAILSYLVQGWTNAMINQHYLNYIPYGINVTNVTYMETESWGIGMPGDNETGLVEFELPENVANEMVNRGIGYFEKLNNSDKWQETPILLSDAWEGARYNDKEPLSNINSPSIENYLDRYGFMISIDPKILAEIDHAISKPGSYYSYQRIGVIIVIPQTRKVIFAYAG